MAYRENKMDNQFNNNNGQEPQQDNPYGQAQYNNYYGQSQQNNPYGQQASYGQDYNSQNYYNSELPPELRKWNWGAFMYNMIWGIGNKCYLPLLCLIPCFNLIWIFVCGAKGNEWAWQAGTCKDLETFKAVQDTWNRAGFVSFIITLASFVLSAIWMIVMIQAFGSFADMLYEFDYNGFNYSDFA